MAGTNTALFLTDSMLLCYAAYYVSVSAWARSGWSSVSFVPRGASSLRQNDCFRMLLHSSPDFSAFLSLVRAVLGSGASCFECFTFTIQQHRPQAHTKGVVATQRGLCSAHKISRQNVPHIYGNEVLFWGVNLAESRWYCTTGSQRLRRRQQRPEAQEFR